MLHIAHLISLIDEHERATGISDTTLSSRVFGDSKKIAALRAGSGIEVKRFNGAFEWFSQNWPKDAVWPDHIERPKVAA